MAEQRPPTTTPKPTTTPPPTTAEVAALVQEKATLEADIAALRERHATGSAAVQSLEATRRELEADIVQIRRQHQNLADDLVDQQRLIDQQRAAHPLMAVAQEGGPMPSGTGVLGTAIPTTIFSENPETLTRDQEDILRGALRSAGYTVDIRATPPFFTIVVSRGGRIVVQQLGGSEKAALLGGVRTLHEGALFRKDEA